MVRKRVSQKFIVAVKMSPMRAYQIANHAGIHYTLLSRFINGAERALPHDHRVIRVGAVLGLTPDECFESSLSQANTAASICLDRWLEKAVSMLQSDCDVLDIMRSSADLFPGSTAAQREVILTEALKIYQKEK